MNHAGRSALVSGALSALLLLVLTVACEPASEPAAGDAAGGAGAGADGAAAGDGAVAPDVGAGPDTGVPADPAPPGSAVAPAWGRPACVEVTGPAPVTFSLDGGATWAPVRGEAVPAGRTIGVQALPTHPGVLVAERAGVVWLSRDAGCTWAPLATLESTLGQAFWLSQPRHGAVIAWAGGNDPLYRVTPDGVVRFGDRPVAETIVAVAIGRDDPNRVRLATRDGLVLETRDEGATWGRVADRPLSDAYSDGELRVQGAAGLDGGRTVLGGLAGVWWRDPGGEWEPVTGFAADPARIRLLHVRAVGGTPLDPAVVWFVAKVTLVDEREPWLHTLYLSLDGGRTVAPTPINDVVIPRDGLVPDPTGPQVVWVGTTRYDAANATWSSVSFDLGWDDLPAPLEPDAERGARLGALAVSPADPAVLYAGLSSTFVHRD